MRISSGVSQLSSNLYSKAMYPQSRVKAISQIEHRESRVSSLAALKIRNQVVSEHLSLSSVARSNQNSAVKVAKISSPSHVTLSMPDGSMVIGYYIDLLA